MIYKAKYAYTSEDIADAYEKERFTSWKGKKVDYLEKKSILDGIKALVGNSNKQLILDAPSGTGRLSTQLIKQGFRVIAVDISIEMLKKSEDQYKLRSSPNFLGYVCCDIEHLPFCNSAFDVVTSLRMMGHLPLDVKGRVLNEFRRISRLGAVIMFSLDNIFLRFKLWILRMVGFRSKSAMWFPMSHRQATALASNYGWDILRWYDMVHRISESRLYVLRPIQPKK